MLNRYNFASSSFELSTFLSSRNAKKIARSPHFHLLHLSGVILQDYNKWLWVSITWIWQNRNTIWLAYRTHTPCRYYASRTPLTFLPVRSTSNMGPISKESRISSWNIDKSCYIWLRLLFIWNSATVVCTLVWIYSWIMPFTNS